MEADEEQQLKAGDSRSSCRGGQPMATVAVVGGGLVGCLQACFLARRGDVRVLLFERRPDIRLMEHVPGRSINMALSCRGRAALAAVGLESAVVAEAIPMHSRMIHDLDGRRRPIRYGASDDQHLLSIDRRRLNEILLTAAESLAGVTVLFEHRLVKVDLDAGELHFLAGGEPSAGEQDGSADGERPLAYRVEAIFACDGAYSLVRQEMQAKTRLNFSQEYISHGYMEVPMPAKVSESGGGREYAMEANYLHIWARDEFMMIGLPNADRSFTGTLFMPFDMFGQLRNDDDVTCFFRRHFPDSLPIIGEENLVRAFRSGRALPLVSVRCEPFHHGGRAVLLGDAAHAMVPFYGQGMNAGFEDCLILDELLTMHGSSSSGGSSPDFALAFGAFSEQRCIDAHAMCDLAMANYVEMRAHVNSWSFLARKKVDNVLHWLLADAWLPLYTSVSFTRTRYHQCVANRAWQDRAISRAFNVGGALAMAAGAATLWRSGAFRADRWAKVLAVCARGVKDAVWRLAIGQSI